jgi:hypothetical protein
VESLIFAIIIGIISMIFNRFQKGDSEKKRKSIPAEKIPNPVQKEATPVKVETEPRRRTEQKTNKEKTPNNIANRFIEKRIEVERQLAEQRERETASRNKFNNPISRGNQFQKKKSSAISFDNLTQDDLVKGIVMSEILGPPRAKKRHHRK